MKDSIAKILIGLVGVFCFLAFTDWLPIEEEAWGKQEDCLQGGENAVLEHLKHQGWKHLEIHRNGLSEIVKLDTTGEEVFMGRIAVQGSLKGKVFMLGAWYFSKTLYSGSGGLYCEASFKVVVDNKISMDW